MKRRRFLKRVGQSALAAALVGNDAGVGAAPPDPDSRPTLTGDVVEWTLGTGDLARRLRLTCTGANVWRLQAASAAGAFDDAGAVQQLAAACGEAPPAGRLPLSLRPLPAGRWRIASAGGRSALLLEEAPFRLTLLGEDGGSRGRLERLDVAADGARVHGALRPGEAIFGLGERFNGSNQRGKAVSLWAEDRFLKTEGNSYLPVPFFLSSRRYSVLMNRYEWSHVDLGQSNPDSWEIFLKDAPLDLYLFLDESPRTILRKLADLSGHAPVPPAWSFGIFVSRHGRTHELATLAGVREMVSQMKAHDLPWTAAILEGWPTLDLPNSPSYADLKTLAAELHAQGKKVLVYDQAGEGSGGAGGYYREYGGRPEYWVRDAKGNTALPDSSGDNPVDAPGKQKRHFLDVTNPDAVRWWTHDVWGPLVTDVGVDGAKIDFCEEFPELEGLQICHGRRPQGMHHLQPTVYNTIMYRMFNRARPEGGVVWSRGGGLGAQRYPFIWTGDKLREFRFLSAVLSGTLSAGLSGVPFVGNDLAGYLPAKDLVHNPEPEVFIRGAQLSCFGPNMETHGTVTRPYDFDKATVDLYRLYCQIHYALVPYLVEQARISSQTGLPLMRHLYLHFPGDSAVHNIEDQFFLGEDLLVAPMLTSADSRNIYLPQGAWAELRSGRVFHGPRWLKPYPAPLPVIPVFSALHPTSAALPLSLDAVRPLLRELGGASA